MYTRKEIASARKIAREHGVNSLLTDPTSNPKTAKNGKILNVLTAPLHLAPHKLSGYQVCPMASEACIRLCLHTAGNPAYMAAKNKARIARTKLFFEHREVFLCILWSELMAHVRKAEKIGAIPGCRLNATSDIAWETVRFPNGQTIFEAFPMVEFYDYTKIAKRMNKFLNGELPRNYYLTYSATENNEKQCKAVLNAGGTVAVAVNVKRGRAIPESVLGYPTVDADIHDYRPNDPKGHFAVLRAKGKAIGDDSGFVWQVN